MSAVSSSPGARCVAVADQNCLIKAEQTEPEGPDRPRLADEPEGPGRPRSADEPEGPGRPRSAWRPFIHPTGPVCSGMSAASDLQQGPEVGLMFVCVCVCVCVHASVPIQRAFSACAVFHSHTCTARAWLLCM